MELLDMVLGYSYIVGKWQASIVIKNGEKDTLKGMGTGDCGEEAVWFAINNAIGSERGSYNGEKKNSVVDFAKQIISDLADFRPR